MIRGESDFGGYSGVNYTARRLASSRHCVNLQKFYQNEEPLQNFYSCNDIKSRFEL